MQDGRTQFRDWIDRRGINQHEAALLLGMSDVFVSQLLAGSRTPGLANAVKIERETGITAASWTLREVSEPVGVGISMSGKRKIAKR